ncbi:MAG: hypothetical protein DWQ07_23810 [Chloroflexi bacterium]|nr:MAG: hypothetical protein DWQ07_23810 [Chloroflexota bacterium]MBL1194174.1 hypothetical protein [Chloroflexota bacterium]NOH11466.1 hypothetical protein [Chloroflexota bacterium]
MHGNNHRYTIIVLILLAGIFLLAACQPGSGDAVTEEIEPQATSTIHAAVDEPVSDEETSTDDPVGEVQSTDECIVCHTDKQMLIDTAEPEVDLHSENEGAG